MFTFEIKYKDFDKSFIFRTADAKNIETYLKDTDVEWVKNCKGDFILKDNKVQMENIIR